jgi:hypothetical protein
MSQKVALAGQLGQAVVLDACGVAEASSFISLVTDDCAEIVGRLARREVVAGGVA